MLKPFYFFFPAPIFGLEMKAMITFILFFFFLLIRSGNSHEVINYSDRPAISFMEGPGSQVNLHQDINLSSFQFAPLKHGGFHSGTGQDLYESESEDFQAWHDYQLQMLFYASLICFSFLLFRVGHKAEPLPMAVQQDIEAAPLYLSQRSLLI